MSYKKKKILNGSENEPNKFLNDHRHQWTSFWAFVANTKNTIRLLLTLDLRKTHQK